MVQELASRLDAWVAEGRATVGETAPNLTAYGLSAPDASEIAAVAETVGWQWGLEDAEGNRFEAAELVPDYAPYRISITKPDAPDGTVRLVSLAGFAAWLEQPAIAREVQVACAGAIWETRSTQFGPWAEPSAKLSDDEPIRVRRVVREISNLPCLPEDLRPWILRPTNSGDLEEPAFAIWAAFSARHLARAVSNEVETPSLLLFRGPPILRLELADDFLTELGNDGFKCLQDAAAWIFESSREMATRHGLFAAEAPRNAPARAAAGPVLRQVAESALEGAKIAYQLHLSQVSRDSLRAMSDLRKAVADETGK